MEYSLVEFLYGDGTLKCVVDSNKNVISVRTSTGSITFKFKRVPGDVIAHGTIYLSGDVRLNDSGHHGLFILHRDNKPPVQLTAGALLIYCSNVCTAHERAVLKSLDELCPSGHVARRAVYVQELMRVFGADESTVEMIGDSKVLALSDLSGFFMA